MKEKLLNNLGLKILSIFVAFFVWLLVVNVSNPEVPKYKDVQIEVLNPEVLAAAGKTYEISGSDTVRITYKVRTRDASLISSSDFHAYIDLADYNVTGTVPVKVDVNEDKEYLINTVTPKPMVIRVDTEDLQKKPFDLKVKPKGTPENGYAVGTTSLSPESVFVSGPVSQVGQISEVGIEVDVEGANSDLSGAAEPIFYDANGNKLEMNNKVTINRQEIAYQMTILKVKDLALNFEVQGTVAAGYRFTGVECDVKSVPVVGMKSVLASLSSLSIHSDQLSIEDATSDRVVKIDISQYLPPSATIAGDFDSTVTVTLRVEPLAIRDFAVSTKNIVLSGAVDGYEYTFDKESFNVTVKGLKEDLDTLEAGDLHPALDASRLMLGINKGTLSFDIGDGFEVVGYSDVYVTAVMNESEPMQGTDAGSTAGDPGSEETPEESTKDASAAKETTIAKETTPESSPSSGGTDAVEAVSGETAKNPQ